MQVDADRSFSGPAASTIDENTIDAPRLELNVAHGWAGRLVDPRRAFDIVGTLVILPFALVLGTITALAIFLDSPGPVFYRSTRVGLGGRTFQMLKFRKFHEAAAGEALTTSLDERFTPIGRFLAVTKLDELPQLWNVLRGEMRLVGPRPEVAEFVECYPDHYREILRVVPGITGPAALAYADESYLLGEHPDPVTFYRSALLPKKIDIDLEYVHHHSVRGDIVVLAHTFVLPFRQALRRQRLVVAGNHQHQHGHRSQAVFRLVPLTILGALLVITFALASSTTL
jgi:lipopolysaccharide/colanic/teichoic acid biosynthesis glycosyltransferase